MTLTEYMTAMKAWEKLKERLLWVGHAKPIIALPNMEEAVKNLDCFFSQFEKEFEASFNE